MACGMSPVFLWNLRGLLVEHEGEGSRFAGGTSASLIRQPVVNLSGHCLRIDVEILQHGLGKCSIRLIRAYVPRVDMYRYQRIACA